MHSRSINTMIIITNLIIIVLAFYNIYSWFNQTVNPSGLGFFLADRVRAIDEFYSLSIKKSIIASILSSIPIFFLVTILFFTNSLYKNIANFNIFTLLSIKKLKIISFLILVWVISDIIIMPITTYVLTLDKPAGGRLIMISVSWGQILGLYLSGFIYVLSNILTNGLKLKIDSDSII